MWHPTHADYHTGVAESFSATQQREPDKIDLAEIGELPIIHFLAPLCVRICKFVAYLSGSVHLCIYGLRSACLRLDLETRVGG